MNQEIKDFNNLRLLVNKSDQHLLIYFYLPGKKNQTYINNLMASVNKFGNRRTKLYISEITKFPGMKQDVPVTSLYKGGYKLIQLNGHVDKVIIDASLKRFVPK